MGTPCKGEFWLCLLLNTGSCNASRILICSSEPARELDALKSDGAIGSICSLFCPGDFSMFAKIGIDIVICLFCCSTHFIFYAHRRASFSFSCIALVSKIGDFTLFSVSIQVLFLGLRIRSYSYDLYTLGRIWKKVMFTVFDT